MKQEKCNHNYFELYQDILNKYELLKKEHEKLRVDKIEDYKTHPYCVNLLNRCNILENDIINIKNEYGRQTEILKEKYMEYDKFQTSYSEKVLELNEEFDKKREAFIRKAKQQNKDEERVEMKALKQEISSLKKKITKYDKKVKTQKKEIKALQLKVVDLSDSGSDIDSDSD